MSQDIKKVHEEHLDFLLGQAALYRRKLRTVEYPARIRLILSRVQDEIETELKLLGVLPLGEYEKKEKGKSK